MSDNTQPIEVIKYVRKQHTEQSFEDAKELNLQIRYFLSCLESNRHIKESDKKAIREKLFDHT